MSKVLPDIYWENFKVFGVFCSILLGTDKMQWIMINKITIPVILQTILNIHSKYFLTTEFAFLTSIFLTGLSVQFIILYS